MVPATGDLSPIIITFSPNGAVEQLYQSTFFGNIVGRPLLDPVHLLVGRRDGVPTRGADLAWGRQGVDDDNDGFVDNATEAGWPGSDDLPNQPEDNLHDANSLWVSINPKSGLVATTQNTTQVPPFMNPSTPPSASAQMIFRARQLAHDTQTMGGR
jgi:hypothetical protein